LANDFISLVFIRSLGGVVLNIFLGLLLIPKIGVVGAASSTLLSHIVVGLLADFLSLKTRQQGVLKMRAMRLGECRSLVIDRYFK
jgi:O-antigen/teichoic acid export membrane protein